MASPNPIDPEVEEELRLRLGMPVRTVLCTVGQINEAIAKHYPREAAGPAAAPAKQKPAAQRRVQRRRARRRRGKALGN